MTIQQQAVDVSAQAAYVATPDVSLGFEPTSIFIINEHASAQIAVSFDGVTDHVVCTPNTPSAGLRVFQRNKKIWCRRVGAGASIIIRIIAETARQ
jgi:hypothetical protein